jgi:hypothetical protein
MISSKVAIVSDLAAMSTNQIDGRNEMQLVPSSCMLFVTP